MARRKYASLLVVILLCYLLLLFFLVAIESGLEDSKIRTISDAVGIRL